MNRTMLGPIERNLIDVGRRTGRALLWRAKRASRRFVALGRVELDSALAAFGIQRAPFMFVHSSLSACGHVESGAATVIEALERFAQTTLVMPTHTYCYPDAAGAIVRFSRQRMPSVVGVITRAFWRCSDVLRRVHPKRSLAAVGSEARALCTGHASMTTPPVSGQLSYQQ